MSRVYSSSIVESLDHGSSERSILVPRGGRLLKSRLFQRNKALEACLVDDKAHITPGATGEHVRLIQRGLVYLGVKSIHGTEYETGTYGPTTAAAVLHFKQRRRIINTSYETQADNIVGKMTISRLDQEVFAIQDQPRRP